MSSQRPAKVCTKCWKTILVSWPPTEHKCEKADLSWAQPPENLANSRAELKALIKEHIDIVQQYGVEGLQRELRRLESLGDTEL
jgi:hypothetical protein